MQNHLARPELAGLLICLRPLAAVVLFGFEDLATASGAASNRFLTSEISPRRRRSFLVGLLQGCFRFGALSLRWFEFESDLLILAQDKVGLEWSAFSGDELLQQVRTACLQEFGHLIPA